MVTRREYMKKKILFSAILSALVAGGLNSINIFGEGEEALPIVPEFQETVIEDQFMNSDSDVQEDRSINDKEDSEDLDSFEEIDNLEQLDNVNLKVNEEENLSDVEINLEKDLSAFDSLEDKWQIEEDNVEPESTSVVYAATGNTERVNQPTLSGIDISNWQAGININALEADFIICKSSGGKDYSDPYFPLFAQTILSSGKLLGYYHFARDTGHEGTAVEEATHFYNTVQNYIGRGIPVLDWEGSALSLGTTWAKSFLDTFYNLSGVKPLLYTSAYVSRSYDWSDVANAGYGLWVAQYADNNPVYGHDTDPWRDNLGVGAFVEPVMHQYTSHGKIPGYNGNLDLNIFYGNTTTWNNLMKPDSTAPTNSMYRLYNPNSGEHFYTKDSNEKKHLVSVGWHDEGIGWIAPRAGEAVYRLYNPNAGDHHYTLNASERDMLIRVGWNYEGIGWYSDPSQGVTLYRAYNPNAVAGAHHYTTNLNEYNHLISIGWKPEGVSWHGVSSTKSAATGNGMNNNSSSLSSPKINQTVISSLTTNNATNLSNVFFDEIKNKTISNPVSALAQNTAKESLIKI